MSRVYTHIQLCDTEIEVKEAIFSLVRYTLFDEEINGG